MHLIFCADQLARFIAEDIGKKRAYGYNGGSSLP